MANPLKGEASFQAGEKTYTLRYDINSLCEAEEMAGLPIGQLLDKLDNGGGLTLVRAMIWAGLQHGHSCHLIEAGEIIGEAGAKVAGDAMRAALRAAFPPAKEGGSKNPPVATDGGGPTG